MVKKTREFHNNESENISSENIVGAALIQGRHLLTFFFNNNYYLCTSTAKELNQ